MVEAIGGWGVRWMPELGDQDLDPHLLMWDMHRRVALAALPPGRTVVQFRFRGAPSPARDWWLVMTPDGADVCDFDPGFPVAATVEAELRCLTSVWLGNLSWTEALRSGELAVVAPTQTRRALPRWLGRSSFAAVPRIPAGS